MANVARSRRNSSRFEESFVYAGYRRILSKRGLVKCQMFAGISAIARRVAQEGHDLQSEPRRCRFHGAAFRRIHESNDAEFGGMRAIYCKLYRAFRRFRENPLYMAINPYGSDFAARSR